MHELLHFLKHLIGLCGEYSHPSLLLTGGVLFTTVGVYWEKILTYFRWDK